MIGKTISHFRIIEKLCRCGMGVVFLAEDTNLNRQVSVKVLPNTFPGDPERKVKILDLGLAKVFHAVAAALATEQSAAIYEACEAVAHIKD
jgi:serine/threonine protein kinase